MVFAFNPLTITSTNCLIGSYLSLHWAIFWESDAVSLCDLFGQRCALWKTAVWLQQRDAGILTELLSTINRNRWWPQLSIGRIRQWSKDSWSGISTKRSVLQGRMGKRLKSNNYNLIESGFKMCFHLFLMALIHAKRKGSQMIKPIRSQTNVKQSVLNKSNPVFWFMWRKLSHMGPTEC